MSYEHVLIEEEKQELLRIARATLKEFLLTGQIPPGAPHRKSLTDPAGAFVSLHAGEDLRGCIGTLQETMPLYRTIQEMAVAAASRDPRFEPVPVDELPALTIEISVLGARRRVSGPDDIKVGTHGISLTILGRRGLLLPQVATDHSWDALTFLEHTCEKAGLPPDAWHLRDTEIEVFTAQVFAEDAAAVA